MKKKLAVVVAILILILMMFAENPVILGKKDLSEGYISAIESQSKGVYSKRVPLVPICVSIDSESSETVFYTIHYFPFGTVEMSYSKIDGYNMEKPLTMIN